MKIGDGISPLSVANYLLGKDIKARTAAMDQMKLIKLVYICHGWHLAEFDLPLVNELAEAWKYGPVFPSIYQQTKHNGENPLTKWLVAPSGDKLLGRQEKLADEIYEDYGKFNGTELMLMSHERGTPWYEIYVEQRRSFFPIPNSLIKAHYKEMLSAREGVPSAQYA